MKCLLSCLELLTLLSLSWAKAIESDGQSSSKKISYLRGRDRELNPMFCGCPGCDEAAFSVYAGDHKCGDRISYLRFSLGFSERDACAKVAGDEFPVECGVCDPDSCTLETSEPQLPSTNKCGCPECDDVWNTMAGDYSCGSRIEWLQSDEAAIIGGPFEESFACSKIGFEEYPIECGKCDPARCNAAPPTISPTAKPTNFPTLSPTKTPSSNPSAAPSIFPSMTPTLSPVDNNSGNDFPCGCSTCDETVLNTFAGDYKCGDRISHLQNSLGFSEQDACSKVAGMEFPSECGSCDPNRCDQPDYNNNSNNNNSNNNSSGQKCGGAVNSSSNSEATCQSDLWNPTGDSTMHCFAYGGSGDPCHLNNNNDPSDGRFKDPSECKSDTLYLWDEPDTQGRNYNWAGRIWLEYSIRFSQQLQERRAQGMKVTSPLLKAGGAGVLQGNMQDFFDACGSPCQDPADPAYIDVIAINAFCGDFNGPAGCRGGASFIYDEAIATSNAFGNIPVYITNWSRLQTSNPQDQVDAIDAIDEFFPAEASSNPIVQRVYWFGATDYGGGSSNNFLTQVLADGSTLGQRWRSKCGSV